MLYEVTLRTFVIFFIRNKEFVSLVKMSLKIEKKIFMCIACYVYCCSMLVVQDLLKHNSITIYKLQI